MSALREADLQESRESRVIHNMTKAYVGIASLEQTGSNLSGVVERVTRQKE